MLKSARVVGIPGAGKTTRALDIIAKVRAQGYSLMQVGFCSFTRAARREAAERASQLFGVPLDTLEKEGWFRTLHSTCAKLLGIQRGAIVNNDTAWLRDALGDQSIAAAVDEDDEESWTNQWRGQSKAVAALSLWDVARNRLCSLDALCREISLRLGQPPLSQGDAEYFVERYEKAKERDGRCDFCDLILDYAGVRMTLHGPLEVTPLGKIPPVPVWLFDEAQDTSPLLDRAARRLASESIWVYLLGDREQGIYTWAGADPDAFMRWPVQHEEYLKKTWRCSRAVIDLGLNLIYQNDEISRDLRTLLVEARCDGGKVSDDHVRYLTDYLDGRHTSTLILARTNYYVSDLQKRLTEERIPWRNLRSPARWPKTTSTKIADALAALHQGQPITGEQWRRLVQAVDKQYFHRGTKSFYKDAASVSEVRDCRLSTLIPHGANQRFVDLLQSDHWLQLVKEEEQQAFHARQKWGSLIDDPKIGVSTIHGSKGMQADQVILSTLISAAVCANLRTRAGQNEERRVWYVGATRARDHLVLLRGVSEFHGDNYQDIYRAM
jgi:superfamily I DNA/RNA helicase